MRIDAAPRILMVAGICAAALTALVASEGAARAAGQEILLPIEAVDPRSLLHGHYVAIDLTQRLAPGEACPAPGDHKWVALRRDGDVYRVAGGADSRAEAQQVGPLPVKGEYFCTPPSPPPPGGGPAAPGWVRLDIGIDRFHINQQEAMRIEQALRRQTPQQQAHALAIVSVGRDGRARLKGLSIDGERLLLDWL